MLSIISVTKHSWTSFLKLSLTFAEHEIANCASGDCKSLSTFLKHGPGCSFRKDILVVVEDTYLHMAERSMVEYWKMRLSRDTKGRTSHIMYKVATNLYFLTTICKPRANTSPLSKPSCSKLVIKAGSTFTSVWHAASCESQCVSAGRLCLISGVSSPCSIAFNPAVLTALFSCNLNSCANVGLNVK